MESKYYTPTIEEFYVKFEFELLTVSVDYKDTNGRHYQELAKEILDKGNPNNIPYTEIWKHCIWNGNYINKILHNLERSKVRVKYLDREDIESLGWEYEYEYKTIPLSKLDKERLEFRILKTYEKYIPKPPYTKDDYWYLTYYTKYKEIRIDNGESYSDLDTIFQGKIKNKSELKKLLKQLGIQFINGYKTIKYGKEI